MYCKTQQEIYFCYAVVVIAILEKSSKNLASMFPIAKINCIVTELKQAIDNVRILLHFCWHIRVLIIRIKT